MEREIFGSNTRRNLVHIQNWLNVQPLEHLGGLLSQAGRWERDGKTPADRTSGWIFKQQVLFAMSPQLDCIRNEKATAIPAE
jgi:hypothetical protein